LANRATDGAQVRANVRLPARRDSAHHAGRRSPSPTTRQFLRSVELITGRFSEAIVVE
jgi:hypothetical protein